MKTDDVRRSSGEEEIALLNGELPDSTELVDDAEQ